MSFNLTRLRNPKCILLYAIAPPELSAPEANQAINNLVADKSLPLALFHDHFIGEPGGIAIFYAEDDAQRQALMEQQHLPGWKVELRPLIFSFSPAALDEQIDFTLRAYRDASWDDLRSEQRPSYGDPRREAQTAEEDN
ncbi:MAG: hypothetical protein ACLFWD_08245 [Anaerolineales bacterium]